MEINKIKTYITTLQTEIDTLKMELGQRIISELGGGGNACFRSMEEKLNLIREKEVQIAEQQRAEAALLEQESRFSAKPHSCGTGVQQSVNAGKSGAHLPELWSGVRTAVAILP